MKIQSLINQHINQLKWHILACFGLIMILPVEEAISGIIKGSSYYNIGVLDLAIFLVPILAGLIACANVQMDLDDKRYIFWRSKPAGIKSLIAFKYIIGLFISFILLACPIIFGIIIIVFFTETLKDLNLRLLVPASMLFTILIYTLCFGCNVLTRSTARAWLIGMLLTGSLFLLPFILPFNYRDYYSIFDSYVIYIVLFPIVIIIAFLLSLLAAQYDWHLRTNLKGLLWVIAGLFFVIFLIFSSQIANIKVLDEKEIQHSWYSENSLNYIGDKVAFEQNEYINTKNDKISFSNVGGTLGQAIPAGLSLDKGRYNSDEYPYDGKLIKQIGNDFYCFYIVAHSNIIERKLSRVLEYDKVTLFSYKVVGSSWTPVSNIDLSDCLDENKYYTFMAMRMIGNKLFVFVDKSFVTFDITNPEYLQEVGTRTRELPSPRYGVFNGGFKKGEELVIPLIPAEGISEQEKITLSIDRYYHSRDMYESSIVDIFDNKISFYGYNYSNDSFQQYEVTNWDQNKIKYKLKDSRQSTILEGLTQQMIEKTFVKKGKLYCEAKNTLMVFDIHSDKGIRKLGHFVRMDYIIEDMAVLEDGNIVLQLRWDQLFDINNSKDKEIYYLCLLKDP